MVKLSEVIDAAWELHDIQAPSTIIVDGKTSNHWSLTRDDLETFMRRCLTQAELACLSLSRNGGPVAVIGQGSEYSDVKLARQVLMDFLWPNRNPSQETISWEDLAKRLTQFQNKHWEFK